MFLFEQTGRTKCSVSIRQTAVNISGAWKGVVPNVIPYGRPTNATTHVLHVILQNYTQLPEIKTLTSLRKYDSTVSNNKVWNNKQFVMYKKYSVSAHN